MVKLYREWQLSGRRRLAAGPWWPGPGASIQFAWIEGGWDADRDGLAEGTQHNTMDVEYFGPTPVIQSWYLAALAAGARMAEAAGDAEFAAICRDVLASGQRLHRGPAVQRHVTTSRRSSRPGDFSRVAARLRSDSMAPRPGRPARSSRSGTAA